SSKKNEGTRGAPLFLTRLVSFALVALILLVFGRVWLSGILGCAGMFENAAYEDEDEKSRAPVQTPIPPLDMFSDSAYDREFPDLVEPTLEPGGEF
ncbi:MAG: hypothetical protein II266_07920, partial [Clostridia bacterium]|nr:hypothetical protein [Clostridia bacterium]